MGLLPGQKRNKLDSIRKCWYYAFLMVSGVLMIYPLAVLNLGKDSWMGLYLLVTPFALFAMIVIPVLSSLGNPGLAIGIVYYFPWMLCIVSVVLAIHVNKGWRHVAYALLWIDVFCNLFAFPGRLGACVVNITLIIFILLALWEQTRGLLPAPPEDRI